MPSQRRRYTKADRAKALGIAVVKGQRAAADETGIPQTTISYWWKQPEVAHLRSTTREEFIDSLWSAVQIGIEEVRKGLASDAPLRDKAVAASMLAEKFLLFRGEATTRTETKALTEGLADHEKAALRAAIDKVLEAEKVEA